MELSLVEKIKNRFFKVALISLLIIIVSFFSVALINKIQADERINAINSQLIGNTYKRSYNDTYYSATDKLTFYENNEVRDKRNWQFSGEEKQSVDFMHKYSIRITMLGKPQVIIIPEDVVAWKPLDIHFNDSGIVKIGDDYVVQTNKNIDPYETSPNITGLIWFTILGCCIIAISFVGFDYLRTLDLDKKKKNELIKQEEEQKEKSRIATIKAFWDEDMSALGFNKDEAILTNTNFMWIADGYIRQAKSFNCYLKEYDCNIKESPLVKKELRYTAIPVDSIQYFSKEGDIQYTTKISGGGGGGYSVTGAIVGGIIAGDAGAVIGSRKKISDVKSELQTHDNRKTIIRYYNGDSIEFLSFDGFMVYNYLLGKIPEKDLLTIQLKGTDTDKAKEDITSPKERLQMLKEWYDSGLINEIDYNEKKNQLLKNL